MTLAVNPESEIPIFDMVVQHPDTQVYHQSGSFGQMTITYHNGLDVDVYVADRNGAVVKLPAAKAWTGKFSIKVERRFSANSVVRFESTRKIGVGFAKESNEELAIKANYLSRVSVTGVRQNGSATKELCLETSYDRIKSLGGAFYHKHTDVVVSIDEGRARHPGSDLSKLGLVKKDSVIKEYNENQTEETPVPNKGASVQVRIIDNLGRMRERFVYLMGVVHKIRPEKSNSLDSGVYITRTGALNEEGYPLECEVETLPLSMETFESVGLFKSYEAAIHWVEELKESQELLLLKKKSEVIKAKHDSEISALERKDHYDKVGSERKDRYESNSLIRKDSSEEVKWVLGTVTVLVGVFALFLKR